MAAKLTANYKPIFILPDVLDKIKTFVELATGEISGMGVVEEEKEHFLVTSIFVPKQKCGPSSTEIDEEDYANMIYDLDKEGIDIGKIRFWWHSHANMGVFWSGTDTTTIKNMIHPEQCLISGDPSWLISSVFNKKGEVKTRLDYFSSKVYIVIDDADLSVMTAFPMHKQECQQVIKDKVTTGFNLVGEFQGSKYAGYPIGGHSKESFFREPLFRNFQDWKGPNFTPGGVVKPAESTKSSPPSVKLPPEVNSTGSKPTTTVTTQNGEVVVINKKKNLSNLTKSIKSINGDVLTIPRDPLEVQATLASTDDELDDILRKSLCAGNGLDLIDFMDHDDHCKCSDCNLPKVSTAPKTPTTPPTHTLIGC